MIAGYESSGCIGESGAIMTAQTVNFILSDYFREHRLVKLFKALNRLPELVEQLETQQAKLVDATKLELCTRHYPPVEMIKDRVDLETCDTVWKCPECDIEYPSPDYLLTKKTVLRLRS